MQTLFFLVSSCRLSAHCPIRLSVNRFACIPHQTQNIYTTLNCGPLLFVCMPFVLSFVHLFVRSVARVDIVSFHTRSHLQNAVLFNLLLSSVWCVHSFRSCVCVCAFIHVAVTASFVLCVDFVFAVYGIDI